MDVGAIVNPPAAKERAAVSKAQENQDRFLTLLVAQMKNQDPMNPMENAQLTTQIAQIQTVTGIEGLKDSIDKMSSSTSQAQALQGVALIGRDVTLKGDRLQVVENGAIGSFELDGAADQVVVDIVTAAGTVVDTIQLGAASKGRHDFSWRRDGIAANAEVHFKITATRGAKPVTGSTFSRDTVSSINTQGGTLGLQLASGQRVGYDAILSVD